jgi:hypothetical protein
MPRILGRPLFVMLLIGLILLQALAFLSDAVDFVQWLHPQNVITSGLRDLGVPAGIASVIAAALLVRRAYLLYIGRPGRWEVSLGLFALKVGAALFLLLAAGVVSGRALSLLLGIAGIAFLLRPSVRSWYSRRLTHR